MEFKEFNNKIKAQFDKMCATGKLFVSNITGNQIWDKYLSSFENEQIFRDPESSEHNCNCCKNFIRRYGNIVAIMENGRLESIFSNIDNVGEYTNPAKACAELLESSQIQDIFFESYQMLNTGLNYEKCNKNQDTYKLGIASNFKQYTQEEADKYGVVEVDKVYEFNHFQIDLPKQFVHFGTESLEAKIAHYRDKHQVFKRAMEEIPLDTLNLVKDLINQGSLLDGNAHLHVINEYITMYSYKPIVRIDNWYWDMSYSMEERTAKFKNTLIGVLCTELAEGMELNKACENWNKRVDPVNYKNAKKPLTESMKREALKVVEELKCEKSFIRRHATIEDIKASEILHLNNPTETTVHLFDGLKTSGNGRFKRSELKDIKEISIEKFMKEVVPTSTSIEVLFENKMEGNLCCLTTAKDETAPNIFKYNNLFSKTFKGNLAGKSEIKQAVKDAGGNVEGVVNCRLAWCYDNNGDGSDLDIWASEPNGDKIGFNTGYRKSRVPGRSTMSGQLDVDNTNPNGKLAVENITWIHKSKMKNGIYKLWINQYSARNSKGFRVEIDIEGTLYSYEYSKPLYNKENVLVAEITLKNNEFSIKHHLPESTSSKTLWNLETNQFHKVNLLCLSPSHWGDNNVGNKYYMFMLEGCKTDEKIKSFHREDLLPELDKHKAAMRDLSFMTMIEPSDKQLAGLGFNSTVSDELIVKVKGSHNRMLKIKF